MAKSIVKFSLLAESYYSGCSNSKNAVRCLSRSIKRCAPLLAELKATGFGPYNHRVLSPRQVRIIAKYLGSPK
ncbi:MAG: DUF4248 domain-containing protein [Mediterranea sp.]|jgi:hypothetical protein|nr:DUF4248 domain-containing protein [Mediterranea sp.]